MKKRIKQIELKGVEAYIEFQGQAQAFDIILPIEEYDRIGRPLQGSEIEITLKVCQEG